MDLYKDDEYCMQFTYNEIKEFLIKPLFQNENVAPFIKPIIDFHLDKNFNFIDIGPLELQDIRDISLSVHFCNLSTNIFFADEEIMLIDDNAKSYISPSDAYKNAVYEGSLRDKTHKEILKIIYDIVCILINSTGGEIHETLVKERDEPEKGIYIFPLCDYIIDIKNDLNKSYHVQIENILFRINEPHKEIKSSTLPQLYLFKHTKESQILDKMNEFTAADTGLYKDGKFCMEFTFEEIKELLITPLFQNKDINKFLDLSIEIYLDKNCNYIDIGILTLEIKVPPNSVSSISRLLVDFNKHSTVIILEREKIVLIDDIARTALAAADIYENIVYAGKLRDKTHKEILNIIYNIVCILLNNINSKTHKTIVKEINKPEKGTDFLPLYDYILDIKNDLNTSYHVQIENILFRINESC